MPQRLKPLMLCENSRAAMIVCALPSRVMHFVAPSHVAVKSAVCENALPFFVVPVQLPVRCFETPVARLRVDDDALAADRGAVRLEAVRLVRDGQRAGAAHVGRRDGAIEVHEAVGARAVLEHVRRDVACERRRDAARGLEPLAGVSPDLAGEDLRRPCPGRASRDRSGRRREGSSTPDSHAVILILRLRVVVDELRLIGAEGDAIAVRTDRSSPRSRLPRDHKDRDRRHKSQVREFH